MRNSGNVVVNGSVAVLIPKEKMALSERQMEYFSSAEYRKFLSNRKKLSNTFIKRGCNKCIFLWSTKGVL